MQDLSIPNPQKAPTLTISKKIVKTEENMKFFEQGDLGDITQVLIKEGFDPSDLVEISGQINDEDDTYTVAPLLIEIYMQRCEWEEEGKCNLCGEYMKTDNSGDEHNRADFAFCSNGCL